MRERDSDLPLSLLAFKTEAEKKYNLPLSKRQLQVLAPIFTFGVPVRFALDLIPDHWFEGRLWDFAGKVLEHWREWERALNDCRAYYADHIGQQPPPRIREWIRAYATEEQIAWAKGQGGESDAGQPPSPAQANGRVYPESGSDASAQDTGPPETPSA